MSDTLPPLPRAAVDEHNLQGGRLLYTADQMRAYGEQCAAAARLAEREACALLVDGALPGSMRAATAAAIRARSET